jgi:hypothetical protein
MKGLVSILLLLISFTGTVHSQEDPSGAPAAAQCGEMKDICGESSDCCDDLFCKSGSGKCTPCSKAKKEDDLISCGVVPCGKNKSTCSVEAPCCDEFFCKTSKAGTAKCLACAKAKNPLEIDACGGCSPMRDACDRSDECCGGLDCIGNVCNKCKTGDKSCSIAAECCSGVCLNSLCLFPGPKK